MIALLKKNLIGLPVFTQSGINIGKIHEIEAETESQTILKYQVKKSLFEKPLLISREQVISINQKSMVVEDAVVKEQEIEAEEKAPEIIKEEAGVITKTK